MKRALIGGFLSLIGSIWMLAVVFAATKDLAISWDAQIGRLLTTIIDMNLLIPFILSIVFIVFGIVIMAVELFRKEK
ncbi:MAG: hypothetical protein IJC39_02675 [Firmicutes bacterium]|nr:hypothetical protein [Bacillota bacterium]